MLELPIDLVFSDIEREHLTSALRRVSTNPYLNYEDFDAEITEIGAGGAPERFADLCATKRECSIYEEPYVILRNCPVDDDLPFLSFDSPVLDKRARKKTFVAEGFLLLYAKLMGQQPIGYINVNDGDVFQDIHPMRSMAETQSQKALETIYFHKDLANHYVRPDWVNILGLRASAANQIYTSYVRNKDLIESLPEETKGVLREEEFNTPFDDLTVASGNKVMGRADDHRILGGAKDYDIRFFENRTIGLTPRAEAAVAEVTRTLHRLKKRIQIGSGDMIGTANNETVHNKEIARIGDPEALRNRWLMKTVNVRDLAAHRRHILEGRVRIVNG
jgi:L-asparagine oxygenase